MNNNGGNVEDILLLIAFTFLVLGMSLAGASMLVMIWKTAS